MLTLVLILVLVAPPDTVHLRNIQRKAIAHHPRGEEVALQASIADLRVENLDVKRLPSFALTGQATYHTDVPTLPAAMGGKALSKDQYRLALGVDQLLYDGGLINQQKEIEWARRDAAVQEVAVETYGVNAQVNAAYFGTLLAQSEMERLTTLADDLEVRLEQVRAQVRNGTMLESNADALQAELIRIEQQRIQAQARHNAGLVALAELTGETLTEDAVLALPDEPVSERLPVTNRPEFRLFELNKDVLAEQQQLAHLKTRPTISAFAEGAYGRPQGNNFFDDTFGPFASAGIRLRWGFWDWGSSRREGQALELEQRVLDTRMESLEQNLTAQAEQQLENIRGLENLLGRDDEVIALRKRIVDEYESQLRHGVITSTQYLIERNGLHQAYVTRDLHQIQLANARIEYLTTTGNL